MSSDNPRPGKSGRRQQAAEELPEPQIFRSRTFRVLVWAVLILLGVSVLGLVAMALWPAA